MNGVPIPRGSAGSNQGGGSETGTAHVLCPPGGAPGRAAARTRATRANRTLRRLMTSLPFAPTRSSPCECRDDLGGESLELLEIVVAGRQHHVLHAGGLQVPDPLDHI